MKSKYIHILPKMVVLVAKEVQKLGGRAILVGGYIRDLLSADLGRDIVPKDPDLEVFGVKYEELIGALSKMGVVNEVGAAFNVIKVNGLDIALPRRDSKIGLGHRDFLASIDTSMSFKEAARRRDFTINAIGLDPLSGEIYDEYDGINDLKRGILRAVDYDLFGDDSLRVLRAMQFVGRFEFSLEERTARICRRLNLKELSKERIGEEWKKLLLLAHKPGIGLEAARNLLIVDKLHPELKALIGTPQNPRWHPEGDVWVHTLGVIDEAARIIREQKLNRDESLVIMFVALTHDFGKPLTTREVDGRIVSYNHAEAGIEPAKTFMKNLCVRDDIVEKVLLINREHMYQVFNKEVSETSVRKLSNRLKPATIRELVWLVEADWYGRGLERELFPGVDILLNKAKSLHVAESAPKPLVLGRHLIRLGIQPGPEMGKILKALFNTQLEGRFSTVEEGIEYYQKHLKDC